MNQWILQGLVGSDCKVLTLFMWSRSHDTQVDDDGKDKHFLTPVQAVLSGCSKSSILREETTHLANLWSQNFNSPGLDRLQWAQYSNAWCNFWVMISRPQIFFFFCHFNFVYHKVHNICKWIIVNLVGWDILELRMSYPFTVQSSLPVLIMIGLQYV